MFKAKHTIESDVKINTLAHLLKFYVLSLEVSQLLARQSACTVDGESRRQVP